MNGFADSLRSAFNEYFSQLKRAVDGITAEEAYSQTSPNSNHIG
jgi:hypothetical protein